MCDSDKVFLLCLVENRGIKENPSKNKHIPSGGSVVGAVVEKLRRGNLEGLVKPLALLSSSILLW